MSNLSPEQRSMMRAEELIRKALSERNPAERTQSLIQVYRFLHPTERDAFVMGLITRTAMAVKVYERLMAVAAKKRPLNAEVA